MILASASPRRRMLLERAGFDLTVEAADVDERRLDGESPLALVERLATRKAQASLTRHGTLRPHETLLAADTIVWIEDDVLGKPRDDDDARNMLRKLSGRTHHVSTGVCLVLGTDSGQHRTLSFVETTDVSFRALSEEEIDAYVRCGEPRDKAGAYGIQGGAGRFVNTLVGDYDNVVGLPVTRVIEELEHMREAQS